MNEQALALEDAFNNGDAQLVAIILEARYAKLVKAAKRHRHVGVCSPLCELANALRDLEVQDD